MKRPWIPVLALVLLTGCTAPTAIKVAPAASPSQSSLVTAGETAPASEATPAPTRTLMPSPTVRPTTADDVFAFEQNRRLGRGVNLGNALEAPVEGEWGVMLEEGYFDLIKEAGFSMVRVPIRWSAHAAAESPYAINPALFERVDWVIEQATRRGLAVVINIHHYEEIMESPRLHKERFLALWEQIAKRYQDQPDSVMFELLNEPNGTLSATSWNDFAAEAIASIRRTNPERILIAGPGDWNALRSLVGLQLPEADRRIIVTFHYYLPFQFTHQGADWVADSEPWLGTMWNGTEDDQKPIRTDFDTAAKWAEKNGRPLFLGEFGAFSKADMDSRARWTSFVARQAEERGFSWAYWEFCSGFGVYDAARRAWNAAILRALIPEG
jgi:endoglucanase